VGERTWREENKERALEQTREGTTNSKEQSDKNNIKQGSEGTKYRYENSGRKRRPAYRALFTRTVVLHLISMQGSSHVETRSIATARRAPRVAGGKPNRAEHGKLHTPVVKYNSRKLIAFYIYYIYNKLPILYFIFNFTFWFVHFYIFIKRGKQWSERNNIQDFISNKSTPLFNFKLLL